jgi:O-acetyl-ADP-ribose deacetylase (regulator of RNase III)
MRIIFSSCDLAEIPYKADYVCDGVGMDYKWKVQPNPPVIKATLNSVSSSLYKSLILLANKGCESIAIPRGMCSRKGGLPEEISSLARHIALSKIIEELTPIKKIVIVGPDYSTSSKER